MSDFIDHLEQASEAIASLPPEKQAVVEGAYTVMPPWSPGHRNCTCNEPERINSTGCPSCWTCGKCGKFGGCSNLAGMEWMFVDPEQRIRKKAYELWLEEGCPDGGQIVSRGCGPMPLREYHWFVAKGELEDPLFHLRRGYSWNNGSWTPTLSIR
jgi:hypothetical protein